MKASIHRNKGDIISMNEDVLLIMGDGDSLRDDLQTFLAWDIAHDVGALGRGIKEYPGKVQHWFNADGDLSIHWARNLPNGEGTCRHTLGDVDGFDVDWEVDQPDYGYNIITGEATGSRMHGSSAMFATLAGLELGYRRIVLAGCPLDMQGHYYWPEKRKDTLGPVWLGVDFMAWIDFREQDKAHKVRSMTGYTAKILGRADKEWLLRPV